MAIRALRLSRIEEDPATGEVRAVVPPECREVADAWVASLQASGFDAVATPYSARVHHPDRPDRRAEFLVNGEVRLWDEAPPESTVRRGRSAPRGERPSDDELVEEARRLLLQGGELRWPDLLIRD